jgi:hypothetical protein
LIFVDSNIPMYLIGAAHPHKAEAQVILERLIAAGRRLVTDAEVLQEILHRYAAIEKREAIGPALQVTLGIVDEVIAIEKADVLRAGEIARNPALLSARDAVHIAVMERHGIRSILSFDGVSTAGRACRGSTGSEANDGACFPVGKSCHGVFTSRRGSGRLQEPIDWLRLREAYKSNASDDHEVH